MTTLVVNVNKYQSEPGICLLLSLEMFPIITYLALVLLCSSFWVHSQKLSASRLLLPYNRDSAVNISIEVLEAAHDACFEWHSTAPHIIKLYPDFDGMLCSKKVKVSSNLDVAERFEAIISASKKGSNQTLICEVFIDVVAKILLLHTESVIPIGGPPLPVSVIAMNEKGHVFSSLNGMKIIWRMNTLSSDFKNENIARFLNCQTSADQLPCVIASKDGDMMSSVLIESQHLGTALIVAELEEVDNKDTVAASFVLNITLDAYLKPSNSIYIFPGALVRLSLETKYRQTLLLNDHPIKIGNISVVKNAGNMTLVGVNYGKSDIVLEYGKHSYAAEIHVVEPSRMALSEHPKDNWKLHEATAYEISVDLFDADGNRISPIENLKVNVQFPSKLFHVKDSSCNGMHYFVQTLVPGSGMIKANVLGLENEGKIMKSFDIHVSQKVIVYQAVQILPSVLLLPFYTSEAVLYSVPLKVTGGTGLYNWTSNNNAAEVKHEENSSNAVVNLRAGGDFSIGVIDRTNPRFRFFSKISVQPVAEIEVHATVVEGEIGNDLIIPVAFYGYESKEKKIYRTFDNCTMINVSVEVVDKYVVSHRTDGDLPPFGRGCLTLQFTCKNPGHSRINILYNSGSLSLRTTVVVACHKPVKAIHPVRVTVLALGTSKEIAFEGGPRPWPLHPSSHYENLTAVSSTLLDMKIIKDPFRYNKDLHVFRVLCKEYGETVLKFFIGNYPSATNRNPARAESAIKIVCCEPQSLHLAYKPKKTKKALDDKVIVKIPFYGSKIFEVDIWIKDSVGRKFGNISSFDVSWKVSDNTIAKLKEYRDFTTHVDGSTGYQKISRNFQQLEMTGKSGILVVTVQLIGYRKDILSKAEVVGDYDLPRISDSIELHLISMRDAYGDVYASNEPENENCDKDSCKT